MKLGIVFGLTFIAPLAYSQTVSVSPSLETDPVGNSGDAADDPAVWIHPESPELSLVIGTDKQEGLAVYDMSGQRIQFLSIGEMNNVDVRYEFPLGDASVDIVTAGNRSNNSIAIYRVNFDTRRLQNVSARTIEVSIEVYGSCMYRSAGSGEHYVFVNAKSGEVEQWRLFHDGAGRIDASLERSFDVGSQTEGCVADDESGDFYIGEESRGIWKYGAEPDDGTARQAIDTTGSGGNLTADVEGLALYYAPDGEGYLIASSQGANEYVIYERSGNNSYIGTFRIASGNSIDGTSDTDGIDVSSANLGPDFPFGAFIAQDGSNSGGNQNFKLVSWEDIAAAFEPSLTVNNTWDPRRSPHTSSARPQPPMNLTVQ